VLHVDNVLGSVFIFKNRKESACKNVGETLTKKRICVTLAKKFKDKRLICILEDIYMNGKLTFIL
jgi:hypothetical protein